MKQIYTFLATIFFATLLHAQLLDTGFNPSTNLVPNSPQAASMMNFEDIPISHYTGIPNINIPLLGISEGTLSANFSLSYHGGGHKVDELATWTGLGWTLNGGGMISRKVRGLPDDSEIGQGFLELKQNVTYGSINGWINSQDANTSIENIAQGCWDTEPDEFYFSFGGYSGKFHFKWNEGYWNGDDWVNGFPVVSSSSKIKIAAIKKENSGNEIIEWEMLA